jgi:iron complex transport system substrate-binding protein
MSRPPEGGRCKTHVKDVSQMKSASHRKPENRIVSLAPSATSILCAIGARPQLVGVTKWCKDVAPVAELPRLGDTWSLDASRIVPLRPTLIIGSVPYKAETVQKLLELPITFLATNPRSLADIEADIRLLASIAGRAAAGEKLIEKMHAQFARISRERTRFLRGRAKPRVYCEAWPNPRISSPPWVAELVDIAGGQMAVPAGVRVSDEEVAHAAPDVIVIAWAATGDRPRANKALGVAAWRNVPAVKNRRVYVVRDEWLNTPGPILVRGAQELSRVLHQR